MGFLFSFTECLFIPIVLYLWLKIAKNCQKWVYTGISQVFCLRFKRVV